MNKIIKIFVLVSEVILPICIISTMFASCSKSNKIKEPSKEKDVFYSTHIITRYYIPSESIGDIKSVEQNHWVFLNDKGKGDIYYSLDHNKDKFLELAKEYNDGKFSRYTIVGTPPFRLMLGVRSFNILKKNKETQEIEDVSTKFILGYISIKDILYSNKDRVGIADIPTLKKVSEITAEDIKWIAIFKSFKLTDSNVIKDKYRESFVFRINLNDGKFIDSPFEIEK